MGRQKEFCPPLRLLSFYGLKLDSWKQPMHLIRFFLFMARPEIPLISRRTIKLGEKKSPLMCSGYQVPWWKGDSNTKENIQEYYIV